MGVTTVVQTVARLVANWAQRSVVRMVASKESTKVVPKGLMMVGSKVDWLVAQKVA